MLPASTFKGNNMHIILLPAKIPQLTRLVR
jgi:hypothetical protein